MTRLRREPEIRKTLRSISPWFPAALGVPTPGTTEAQSSFSKFHADGNARGLPALHFRIHPNGGRHGEPKTLHDLFHDTLKDIYFAEKKILTALPKMAKAAQSEELTAAFEKHEDETEEQVARLEKVFAIDRARRRARPAMRSWASSTKARKS